MAIFLLSGWSGSGKDAVGSILGTYGFQRLAFADALKVQVAEELNIPLQWTHTQHGKRLIVRGKTVRDHLIQRGQEIRIEQCDPGYFARKVYSKIDTSKNYVITDWRLLAEYKALEDFTFKVITVRVTRNGQETSYINDSLTEHELDTFPFDVIIINNGQTWEKLEEEITKKLANWL
jgi:dephospho-CoA kinase